MANENETKTVEETKVEKVDIDIDDIFSAAPGGDSITLPEEEKSNFFSRKNTDTSFIDKPVESKTEEAETTKETKTEEAVEKEEEEETSKETITPKEDVNVDEVLGLTEESEEQTTVKRGRKPIEGMADMFNKLIKSNKIVPFDDEKALEDYSAKDFEELIQANLDERTRAVRSETPKQFFQSLPQELQIAARYVADGGTDLKGLFGTLAQVEETREIDAKSEQGQERIITEYLSATGYGSAEEIAEEIEIWKDLGKLEKQAKKFKPKLDKMQEKVVAKKLQEQQMKQKQQEQASQNYMKNVYNTLRDGRINNIKVDRKTQSLLYNGLVNPNYPSISGKNTNLLGHLLEKYQFVEPNYPLITEALWLLADPKGYKTRIMQQGETRAVEKTVRKLKTAQSQKSSGSAAAEGSKKTTSKRRTLPRGGNNNFFKRF
tara:strand:- start:56696 stop:57994 length:1299 start_codon:yes stop_codon:yes gene_type:complete